jgi:hypothetical protein
VFLRKWRFCQGHKIKRSKPSLALFRALAEFNPGSNGVFREEREPQMSRKSMRVPVGLDSVTLEKNGPAKRRRTTWKGWPGKLSILPAVSGDLTVLAFESGGNRRLLLGREWPGRRG